MKKTLLQLSFVAVFSFVIAFVSNAQSCTPVAVTKTNSMKVLIHYMPWFTAPDYPVTGTNYPSSATGTANAWGTHWTSVNSNTENPNNFSTVTNYLGQSVQVRDIISHYHPLIGPYDSKDTNLIEYHLLLMKLSGIDGIIIDWYGNDGQNDHPPLLVNSNALIAKTRNAGLKYSIMQEDGEPLSLANAQTDGTYAQTNYFTDSQYTKLGFLNGTNSTTPLICLFGPANDATLDNTTSWGTIFGTGNLGAFLTFMQQSSGLGSEAAGEFAWPQPSKGDGDYNTLSSYYSGYSNSRLLLGSAFAGFNDFYGTNGADADGIIDTAITVNSTSTNTLSATLNLCKTYKSSMLGIQLATWNDFTEGTMLEPTVERGFESLVTIQQFTGVPYTQHNLEEVYKLFTLRKQYNGNSAIQLALNKASCEFTQLDTLDAEAMIDCIASTGTATGCGTPVPVTLISFTGSLVNSIPQLQWQTANETGVNRFEIDRSPDDINFSTLSEANAVGSGNNNYSFTDIQPLTGKNYYQLKMINNDGGFTYSNIILISVGSNNSKTFDIYPNPVSNQLTVQYDNPGNDAIINIFSSLGQKVLTVNTNGQNKTTIDVSNLAVGTYIVQLNRSSETQMGKFVKVD